MFYHCEPALSNAVVDLALSENIVKAYTRVLSLTHSHYQQHPTEQFFHTDYHSLIHDRNHYVVDENTQLPPHTLPPPYLVNIDGDPYPSNYQEALVKLFRPAQLAVRSDHTTGEDSNDYDEYMKNHIAKMKKRILSRALETSLLSSTDPQLSSFSQRSPEAEVVCHKQDISSDSLQMDTSKSELTSSSVNQSINENNHKPKLAGACLVNTLAANSLSDSVLEGDTVGDGANLTASTSYPFKVIATVVNGDSSKQFCIQSESLQPSLQQVKEECEPMDTVEASPAGTVKAWAGLAVESHENVKDTISKVCEDMECMTNKAQDDVADQTVVGAEDICVADTTGSAEDVVGGAIDGDVVEGDIVKNSVVESGAVESGAVKSDAVDGAKGVVVDYIESYAVAGVVVGAIDNVEHADGEDRDCVEHVDDEDPDGVEHVDEDRDGVERVDENRDDVERVGGEDRDGVERVGGEDRVQGENIQAMLSSLVYSLGLGEQESQEAISLWLNRTIIPRLDSSKLSSSLSRRWHLYVEECTHYQAMLDRGSEVASAEVFVCNIIMYTLYLTCQL